MKRNIVPGYVQTSSHILLAGVDPHKRMHAVVIQDFGGRVVTRFKVRNSAEGYTELWGELDAAVCKTGASGVVVGVEAGAHFWRNVMYYLDEKGVRCHLVNPYMLKRRREGQDLDRRKTDYRDAAMAATLVGEGSCSESTLPKGDYAELRVLYQAYRRCRKDHGRVVNQLHGQLDGYFPEFGEVFRDLRGKAARAVLGLGLRPAMIASMSEDEFANRVREAHRGPRLCIRKVRMVWQASLNSIGVKEGAAGAWLEIREMSQRETLLAEHIEELKRELAKLAMKVEEGKYLATIPGLGLVSIAGLVAETGPFENYGSWKGLVKLAGTNPTRSESADKAKRHNPISKKGRAGLRSCLWSSTLNVVRNNPDFREWCERLTHRNVHPLKRREALTAAMNRLLRIGYTLVARKESYQAPTCRNVEAA